MSERLGNSSNVAEEVNPAYLPETQAQTEAAVVQLITSQSPDELAARALQTPSADEPFPQEATPHLTTPLEASADESAVSRRGLFSLLTKRTASDTLVKPEATIESVTSKTLEKKVERRGFLKGTARVLGLVAFHTLPETIAANALIAYEEDRYIEKHWEKTKASVNFLNFEYDPSLHEEVFFYFPGLGDIHSKQEANDLLAHGGMPENAPLAYITMSHQHTTVDEVVELIRNEFDGQPPRRVSFFGRSFGGPLGLEVMAKLGIPLDRFVLFASPDSIHHANFGGAAAWLDKWTPRWDWLGFLDLDAKFIASFESQRELHGNLDIAGNVERAEHTVKTGESPIELRDEVHILRLFDLHSKSLLRALSKIMKPGITKGKYVASYDPRSDHTVWDRTSEKGFADVFDKLGVEFGWKPAHFKGHGEIGPSARAISAWMEKINAQNNKSRILADGPSK